MTTRYEAEMYANIGRIARALEAIAGHLGELVREDRKEEENGGNA